MANASKLWHCTHIVPTILSLTLLCFVNTSSVSSFTTSFREKKVRVTSVDYSRRRIRIPNAHELIQRQKHAHGDNVLPIQLTTPRNDYAYVLENDRAPAWQELSESPQLVIILPAYNEENRILETLHVYTNYLSSSRIWGSRARILVVDDGSTDETRTVVENFAAGQQSSLSVLSDSTSTSTTSTNMTAAAATTSRDAVCSYRIPIQFLSLSQNEGKGAAVAKGIFEVAASVDSSIHSPCDILLIADADGSGDIACLNDMVTALYEIIFPDGYDSSNNQDTARTTNTTTTNSSNKNNGNGTVVIVATNGTTIWKETAGVVVGNRGYDGILSIKRAITRWGFRTTVKLFCGNLHVPDTQCGFKLLTMPAARVLYQDLQLQRWTHDVEVLYRAKQLKIPVSS